jgi:hypothetical protein
MGFDIFFVGSRVRDEVVEGRSPFTGKVMSSRPQEPLADPELRAIRAVLLRAGAQEDVESGYSIIRFGDGGEAEFQTTGLEKGCTVTLRGGPSRDCLRFLVDLLNAAEWVMLPAMEGNPAIVSTPGLASGVADGFPKVVCGSPEELDAVLSGGYQAWERYRDQVVGDGH